MICVSIGRTRHKMVVLEHQALAKRGAELVELRLDWLSHVPNLGRLLTERPTPVVVTCRRESDKGRWRGSEDQRVTLLRSAIVEGVEYIDLEDDIARKIPRYGDTQRIISHHNFEQTPEDIEVIHARMCQMDPDIVKLVTMANTPSDTVRILQLVKDASVPTVAFCMGELGVASRILCGKYGAPFTYATFSKDRELAPGQLSFEEMRDVYRYDEIGSDTNIFGVLGDPIAHSLSPLIHNSAFKHAGLNCVYLAFRVPKFALSKTLDEYKQLDVQGYSVTIPHKEAIVAKATHHDQSVQDIGAANTLFRNTSDDGQAGFGVGPDGQREWQATNTDYAAAMQSIKLGLTGDAGGQLSLVGKNVIMLGAGGVARAIGMGVVRAGGALCIASRTHARAIELAEKLGCRHIQWENRATIPADILINCTPVGMHPNVDETPFEPNWFGDKMLVFDTVYNPENTLLLKQARERDCQTVNGIEMFVRQAALQFELFTNQSADIEQMRATLRREISAVKS